jgi:hypothetical protein
MEVILRSETGAMLPYIFSTGYDRPEKNRDFMLRNISSIISTYT